MTGRIAGPDAVWSLGLGAGGGLAKPSLSESAWCSQSSPWEPPVLSLGLQPTMDTEAGGEKVKGARRGLRGRRWQSQGVTPVSKLGC